MSAICKFLSGLMAALSLVLAPQAQSAPGTKASIVLVHGALFDGSSWRGVYDVLTRDGYRVNIVQVPLTGLNDDVAATRRVLDQIDGPIVLMGQSYGGSIITVAGADTKVKALVYVVALQPDVGESSNDAASAPKIANDVFKPSQDGFIFIDPAKLGPEVFPDLPKRQADFLAHAQMPIFGDTFNTKLAVAAWHDKPSYAVIAKQDHVLIPERAHWLAKRAGSKVTEISGGHAAHVTQPRAVARVIEQAARGVN